MSFTTQIFIFVFFPLCILCYYALEGLGKNKKLDACICKFRLKDLVLICFSLGFYMWACFDDVIRLGLYILFVYMAGRTIEKRRTKKISFLLEEESASGGSKECKRISWALPFLCLFLSIVVFCLVYFKYTHILIDVWNFSFRREIVAQSYLAPIGLSFITFSAISYLVDIYRNDADAGSLIDCVLYLSFFPKIVSGPVVLWKDFKNQIVLRNCNLDRIVVAINRIMIGFAKKLILADKFGSFIASTPLYRGGMDPITTLVFMFAYMLQIYFDFSGYSDIALGMAALFGFEFKENFNFPYCSKSISEFWRRWHISLGTWFKEYVYIPLGGSRCDKRKAALNQAIVFLLTGLWHGAGWNYLLWGGINGFFVILEKFIAKKNFYLKTPDFVKWFSTMLITFGAWQLFRFHNLEDLVICIGNLLGRYSLESLPYTWRYYLDLELAVLMIIGSIGSVVLSGHRLKALYQRISNNSLGFAIQEIGLFILFGLAILCMINSTYSPFIYFQY